jgi:hypothetical protein
MLRDRDQTARTDFGARATDTLYGRQLMSLDSTIAGEMTVILNRFGLPTKSMVGPAGANAAMLIVQHNFPLQERVLALTKAVPPGELSPESAGMLEDRVLVHQGKPQLLGTQFNLGSDGFFRFAPVADTAALDARRAAAGMPPLTQYVCLMEQAGMHIDRGSLPPMSR